MGKKAMGSMMTATTIDTDTTYPLIVDLDGTLIRSDTLMESFFALASASPWQALLSLRSLRGGRAPFKAEVARQVPMDVAALPYNEELLVWLQTERARGRKIYLASASHETYVQQVADYIGIFDGVFASDGVTNLRSRAKAELLCKLFGAKKFDYVGNEKADLAVWEQSAGVIVTYASEPFQRVVQQRFPHAMMIHTATATRSDYWRAMRPHQWLKNLLIFVPALAAQHFDLVSFITCLLAFFSFSLCASSGYLLNDLLDARNDRQHPTKRDRPFAAGTLFIYDGIKIMLRLLLAAILLAVPLPPVFLGALVSYYLLTLLYSTLVKRQMLLDVIFLALLYSVRLIAGGAAVGVMLSPWLLSFSMFIFLSLALIKRCAELMVRKTTDGGDPKGRDYRLTDLPILTSMAAASGYVAALTSGLYISSAKVVELYSHPERLWALPVILLFWISRILMLMHRGEMLEDPVLFAARDRTSLICGAVIGAVLLVSI